jgi:hypothetical protein
MPVMIAFGSKLREWRDATAFVSDIDKTQSHQAYKSIVSMGPEVAPFILDDMRSGGCGWSVALTEVTGHDPVPAEDAGDCGAILRHWLSWFENQ